MKKRAIIPGVNQSIIEIKIYPNMLFNYLIQYYSLIQRFYD